MIQRRDIALAILFTILTIGIYGYYWIYRLNQEVDAVSYEQDPKPGSMVIALTIVTLGIYGIYWCYKTGQKVDRAYQYQGMQPTQRSVPYLLFCIFGLSVVSIALIQSDLNLYADVMAAGGVQAYASQTYGQQYSQAYGQQPNAQQYPQAYGQQQTNAQQYPQAYGQQQPNAPQYPQAYGQQQPYANQNGQQPYSEE